LSDFPDLIETDTPPAPTLDLAPWQEYLVAEGYRPEVDEDGDIRFRHEGRTIYLILDASDPCYLRVSMPGVWECEGPEQERRGLEAVNAVNRDLKVVKCVLVDGTVWASAELFADPPDAIRAVFRRCLDAIGSAAWQIRERIRKAD
jgi:hypothetical protein